MMKSLAFIWIHLPRDILIALLGYTMTRALRATFDYLLSNAPLEEPMLS